MPCWGEKLDEELDPLLPGSEQFRLQQSRAIETCGVLLADCDFLQQSGILAIEPSLSCAPAPTAPPSMAATRVKAVNHFRIAVSNDKYPLLALSSKHHEGCGTLSARVPQE
jgi:hypothetical protein